MTNLCDCQTYLRSQDTSDLSLHPYVRPIFPLDFIFHHNYCFIIPSRLARLPLNISPVVSCHNTTVSLSSPIRVLTGGGLTGEKMGKNIAYSCTPVNHTLIDMFGAKLFRNTIKQKRYQERIHLMFSNKEIINRCC